MPSPALQKVLHANSRHSCEVTGCTKRRVGLSRHCKVHRRARNLHGDPRGKSLHPRHYAPQRAIVSAFLEENSEHVGVQNAIGWIAAWLSNSCVDSTLPSATEMRRLFDAGV